MSAASSPAMPGAYSFRDDLVINTNRPLSTFSTDTLFFSPTDSAFGNDDDLKAELQAIAQLRRDVRNNLSLRPLNESSAAPPSATAHRRRSLELETPLSATSSVFSYTTAPSSPTVSGSYPGIYSPQAAATSPATYSLHHHHPTFSASLPDIHNPLLSLNHPSITPQALAVQLSCSAVPLIIDTRSPAQFEAIRIRNSINLAIPSLILKRGRKPNGGFQSLSALRSFITDDDSRLTWDMMLSSPRRWNGDIVVTDELMDESGSVAASTSTAWSLLPALSPLADGRVTYLRGGITATRSSPDLKPFLISEDEVLSPVAPSPIASPSLASPFAPNESVLWSYLQVTGTPSPASADSKMQFASRPLPPHLPSRLGKERAVSPERTLSTGATKRPGLFLLKTTDSVPRSRETMPVIDDHSSASTTSSSFSSSSSSNSQPSTGNVSSGGSTASGGSTLSRRTTSAQLYDASPSPSPSASTFPRGFTRNRGMTLGIDTKSAERLRIPSSSTQHPLAIPMSPTIQTSHTQGQVQNQAENPNQTQRQPPKLHLRTLPPTKSSTLDVLPTSPGAGPSGGFGNLGRLHLPRSPHRPNLIVTSSPTSAARGNEEYVDGEEQSQYLQADPSHLRQRRTDASRSRSPGSPTSRRKRSPSPWLRSPRTARPTEGFPDDLNRPPPSLPPPSPRFANSSSNSFFPSESSSLSPPLSSDAPEPPESFTVSTILPNFLYLGPEISAPEHAAELHALGVKRVLNMAIECDDEDGLARGFDKYHKIPMRDTVEEENVIKGVREVCQFLDDARLHSQPTYVHCKAGKSRSVTAVMAYLIHANHWPLARAYAFVLDRRRGISPNIGFVSELMNFEEEELGRKSLGVIPTANLPPSNHSSQAPVLGTAGATPMASVAATNTAGGANNSGEGFAPGHGHSQSVIVGGTPYGSMMMGMNMTPSMGGRRGAHHVRESLPPAFSHQPASTTNVISGNGGDGGDDGAGSGFKEPEVGDAMAHAQEVEIKDADGRYRHARRAPVDEHTLQPMRRASKAGLESSNWTS